MKGKYPNGLKEAMTAAGIGPTKLAALVETSKQNISRWADAEQKLTVPWAQKIAPHLGFDAEALIFPGRIARRASGDDHIESSDVATSELPDIPRKRMVRLVGYVGAGSAAHYYAVSDEDYEEVEAPPGATDQTVAVEIRGKSLGPFFDTWLVFYRDVRSPVGPELYGRICVVGLADDRILIKKIHHNRDGSFTLISNSGDPPIENAQIEWAAKVTDMRPKDEG